MLESRAFRAAIWTLVLFTLILVGQQISFVFRPLVVLVTTIFFPVLVAGLLFYLTNPLVGGLERWRIPRTAAILLFFLLFGTTVAFLILFIGPNLQQQLSSLITDFPHFMEEIHEQITDLGESTVLSRLESFQFFQDWSRIDFESLLDSLVQEVVANLAFLIGSIANFVVVVFTIPFLLFYMLRDGHQIPDHVATFFPRHYREHIVQVLHEISRTISAYVQGVLIVSLFVGILVYIGYLIIGLDYALLLGVTAMLTNIIPYFGPVIGTVPGLIVGLIDSPMVALQVLLMVGVVQQLESQLVSPQVLGRRLKIHPVTIIVVLLTGGSLAGFLGIILAVPTYAVGRVIFVHIQELIQSNTEESV